MASATHYPYVQQWNNIDRAIADGVSAALLGKKTPQQALDNAAAQVDSQLG
jgi:multiple sugar transport system substrate-binding protein